MSNGDNGDLGGIMRGIEDDSEDSMEARFMRGEVSLDEFDLFRRDKNEWLRYRSRLAIERDKALIESKRKG